MWNDDEKGQRRPDIFEIATAYENGNGGIIRPRTNVVVNTNRLWYGKGSTVSAFLATAYDEQGKKVDSMEGYFLEPATDYDRAKVGGSDTSIMSGQYNVIAKDVMKKRIVKRRKLNGENIEEKDINLKYDWYVDNPPGRSGIAIHGGRTGEHTTGCLIPGDSFEFDAQRQDYIINNKEKKQKLFDFFNNYGRNGIIINVGPHFKELYK